MPCQKIYLNIYSRINAFMSMKKEVTTLGVKMEKFGPTKFQIEISMTTLHAHLSACKYRDAFPVVLVGYLFAYHSFPLSSSHNNRFPKKIANGYLHCSHACRASEPTFSSLRSGIISCGQRCQMPARENGFEFGTEENLPPFL